jgi:WD40 repeat protein
MENKRRKIECSINKEEEIIMIKLELRGKIFTVDRNILINVSGTYFTGMLSSGVWQPNDDGVYIIDRPSEGFERILDCLSTGKLDCDGLSDYEIECVYSNLDYFLVPFTRVWNYSKVAHREDIKLSVHLQLKDGRLCGNREDHTICLFNMDTDTVETTMEGHTDDIHCIIRLQDERVCSCSCDNTIKLWSIESGQCDLTLVGHDDFVHCLIQLLDGRLCSGSYDKTIKIWRTDTGVCEVSMNDGTDNEDIYEEINSVACIAQLRNAYLCIGDYRGDIIIWNLSTEMSEITLSGHDSYITATVIIDEERICSCSTDKKIKIWKIPSGVCDITLNGHTSRINHMVLLVDRRLCSISYDSSVKIWNLDTGVCDLSTAVGSVSQRKVMQLNDGRLLVSKVYKFEVYFIGA